MSQTSYLQMVNEPGLPFRQHLNEFLSAITTQFQGDTAPTAPVAYMKWLDTSVSPPVVRQRNSINTAWELSIENQLKSDLDSNSGSTYIGVGSSKKLYDLVAAFYQEWLSSLPIIVVITGQSNAAGTNTGGTNPANPNVKVWDGVTGDWGSSDYTQNPFARSQPDGNVGNNNIGLAFAHRLAEETGRPVYVVYDAVGGRPISDWVGSGTSSVRYAAIKTKVEAALASPELSSFGLTAIDYLIWGQGEENALTDTFSQYLTSFTTLDTQFRNETWMDDTTPMFVLGMSGLHTRYQVWQAQLHYCENVNRSCIYVNSTGLKTQYDVTASGDYTHWLGEELWRFGYYRIWDATKSKGMSHRENASLFYGRGTGPANANDGTVITTFTNLVSRDSATSEFPLNSTAATGSIAWGNLCVADGNYTVAGGWQVTNDNLTNYSFAWGRECTQDANADYSGMFGYQNAQQNTYQFVAGRGHILVDTGTAAIGTFSKYTTTQTDIVLWQVGSGGSTGSRANAFAVRKSGVTEHLALTVATLPAASNGYQRAFVTDSSVVATGNFGNVVAGGGANKVPVYSDGANWRIG